VTDQQSIEAQRAQFERWAREQLQACGEYVQQHGLITAEANAKAGWAIPEEIFVGLVTSTLNPDLSFWVITGPGALPDHIEGKVAADAREAVRHFALRWQLHGAQANVVDGEAVVPSTDAPADGTGTAGIDWNAQGAELAKRAEMLYAYTMDDGYWPPAGD
jgi:hypothetical protein